MAYQHAPSPPMTPALFEACDSAIHVVTRDGQVMRAGLAALFVLGQIGYHRQANLLRARPWIWVVEGCYRVVAGNRPFFARFLFRK